MKIANPHPSVSVVVLNYNGAKWISRCLESLRTQTIFAQLEIIVADNRSSDGSDTLAEAVLRDWPNGHFIQHGDNLGFCEGNNRAALAASGDYLFFLNNDTWLEPDCLEKLVGDTRRFGAAAAAPLVMNYDSDSVQLVFGVGFDIFGLPRFAQIRPLSSELFMPPGCSYLIETELFQELGGFDREIFLYCDELDLSWRVWLSGHKCAGIQTSRLHHRWAANENPEGGEQVVEMRTSDSKRFYSNRNSMLVLLKNTQWLWVIVVPLQLLLFGLEGLVGCALLRRWAFFKRSYLDAITGCWRLRKHVLAERQRIRRFRRRGDLWMLRFGGWRLNRWDEIKRVRRFGVPKVTPR